MSRNRVGRDPVLLRKVTCDVFVAAKNHKESSLTMISKKENRMSTESSSGARNSKHSFDSWDSLGRKEDSSLEGPSKPSAIWHAYCGSRPTNIDGPLSRSCPEFGIAEPRARANFCTLQKEMSERKGPKFFQLKHVSYEIQRRLVRSHLGHTVNQGPYQMASLTESKVHIA